MRIDRAEWSGLGSDRGQESIASVAHPELSGCDQTSACCCVRASRPYKSLTQCTCSSGALLCSSDVHVYCGALLIAANEMTKCLKVACRKQARRIHTRRHHDESTFSNRCKYLHVSILRSPLRNVLARHLLHLTAVWHKQAWPASSDCEAFVRLARRVNVLIRQLVAA